MRQHQPVRIALRHQHVRSRRIAFALRLDRNLLITRCRFDHRRQGDRCSAEGESSLRDMVRLFNRKLVAGILQRLAHLRRQLQHHLHADGEVRPVQQPGLFALCQSAHVRQLVVPAGRADHHLRARRQARAHVLNHGLGSGEVDHHIESRNKRRSQGRCVCIFLCVQHMHAVAALSRDLRHQLARLALSQHQYPHRVPSYALTLQLEPGPLHRTPSRPDRRRTACAGSAPPLRHLLRRS